MLYFPYVYPKKDIDQKEEFAEKMNRDFGLLKMKNGALYSILEGTLDKNWIKELWEYINPVKHENLHPISKRYTKLGPNITIGGTFTQNPGGKIIINDGKGNERVITEAFKFSPDDAIPEKVRDVFTQEEKLSKSDASNLCCKMRVWLQEESELLKMIYLQIGQTMES